MKAIIFNSGLGHRMGDETKTHHKSMTVLENGETIFHRQIRLLSAEGVKDFIITTGPFAEQLQAEAANFPALNFTFVPNEIYDQTNYIYSMFKAREFINDDMLFLHGDLVFNRKLVRDLLACPHKSAATVNFSKALPEKDFKGRVKDGKVVEFIHDGNCKCYAENALNEIFPALSVYAFSYEGYYVDEIDNMDDYARVKKEILPFDAAEG